MVPETIGAIRALTETVGGDAASIRMTNQGGDAASIRIMDQALGMRRLGSTTPLQGLP